MTAAPVSATSASGCGCSLATPRKARPTASLRSPRCSPPSTALPGWPAQAVTFVAEQAMSEWGEGIYVRGDLDALSAWGTRGQGVALTTTAATYPTWTHATPISIPLGATFEWKLVAVSAQGVR